MTLPYESHDLAVAVADLLAHPDDPRLPIRQPWWQQSLALGVPGIALLHVELAAAGLRPWQRAHHWLTAATSRPGNGGPRQPPLPRRTRAGPRPRLRRHPPARRLRPRARRPRPRRSPPTPGAA